MGGISMVKTRKTIVGLTAGLGAASIWGGMYVVSKVVLDVIPPFALLSTRLLLGAATLLPVIILRMHKPAFSCDQVWSSLVVGFIGYGISLGFQFVGTRLSTASNGALVTSATPAFVLLFAPYLLGEKITPRRVAALVVATLGVIAVIDPRHAELSPSMFIGNLSLLGAALTWALYSVLVRKISAASDLLLSSTIMLLGGLPSSLTLGAFEIPTIEMNKITSSIIWGTLYLGVISTALAMFLWNYAFATLPAGVASLTFFAQPVVGVLLGWLLLSEPVNALFFAGGSLIVLGIFLSIE
jgi:drug/metabolite transporter (DMT)-like permease